MTEDHAKILRDPEFQELLSKRSRWRWSLSLSLIGAYCIYAIGGLYYPEAYARPFGDSAMPLGIVVGLLLIGLSMVLSIIYIRVVNRFKSFAGTKR